MKDCRTCKYWRHSITVEPCSSCWLFKHFELVESAKDFMNGEQARCFMIANPNVIIECSSSDNRWKFDGTQFLHYVSFVETDPRFKPANVDLMCDEYVYSVYTEVVDVKEYRFVMRHISDGTLWITEGHYTEESMNKSFAASTPVGKLLGTARIQRED